MEELYMPVFTLTPTTNRMLELKALNPTLPYLSVHLWCKCSQEQILTTGSSLSKQFVWFVLPQTSSQLKKCSQVMGTVLKDQDN